MLPMVTRGAAFAMDDLSQVQVGEDALANIRSQLARDMNRKITCQNHQPDHWPDGRGTC